MATPGLLKTTIFWNKSYNVIIQLCDVTNKFFSRDSCCFSRDSCWFMWQMSSNSSIAMKEVVITLLFLLGGIGSSSMIRTGTMYDLKNLQQCGKRVNIKSQKVLRANYNVWRRYMEKTGTGDLSDLLPSRIGLSSPPFNSTVSSLKSNMIDFF